MKISEIEVGKTYRGKISYKEGFSTHRTVISMDSALVSFRNEVGINPPSCYVDLASMTLEEFASWSEEIVATPARAARTDLTVSAVQSAEWVLDDGQAPRGVEVHQVPIENIRCGDVIAKFAADKIRAIANLVKANGFDPRAPVAADRLVMFEDRLYASIVDGAARVAAARLANEEGAGIETIPVYCPAGITIGTVESILPLN